MQLAVLASIPQPNLCALEADRFEPKLSTIRRLAVALAISPGELIERLPPPPAWNRQRIDHLVRQAFSPEIPQGPQASQVRALKHVLHERLAAAGRGSRRPLGTGKRSLRRLQADLGPALWNTVVRRLDKFR